jgi:hypothetical protein
MATVAASDEPSAARDDDAATRADGVRCEASIDVEGPGPAFARAGAAGSTSETLHVAGSHPDVITATGRDRSGTSISAQARAVVTVSAKGSPAPPATAFTGGRTRPVEGAGAAILALMGAAALVLGRRRGRETVSNCRADLRVWRFDRPPPHFASKAAEGTTSVGCRGVKAFAQWHPPEDRRSFSMGTAVGPMGVPRAALDVSGR